MVQRIRVLVAKPGLDGHDRGVKLICMALRDAGMEVIYTGLRQTTDAIVNTALQEGVDAILLSCLSGAHDILFPEIMEKLKAKGCTDILVIGGGIIPKEDIPSLRAAGIQEIFGPGTKMTEIIEFLRRRLGSLD
ncbi:MAG: cobalamin B12-binding domain-containing protein [Thermodesulfobacteriota bacterium]|jgi:methylmalonyl-CoA mutase C-terminal domain/subunit